MPDLPPNPVDFETAAALLRSGEICAFPTETVYGLGADAGSDTAVLKIYTTKARPRFNPLIVHCADREMARAVADFSPLAERLAEFWPGPLTLVLPLKAGARISDLVTAGLDNVGIRVPGHNLARDLIAAVGRPLAAPSANPSGRLSPTNAEQVRAAFDDTVSVLDGGPAITGVESTIIAIEGNGLIQLRAGGLPRDLIADKVGGPVELASEDTGIAAPGMLKSHYAPKAHLRLEATEPRPGERYLGFGQNQVTNAPNLSPRGDLAEAARNLFAMLHALDAEGVGTIAVAPVPNQGLGEAINDRLRRASAPRNQA